MHVYRELFTALTSSILVQSPLHYSPHYITSSILVQSSLILHVPLQENQSEMENASKKRRQRRERNIKMFDQFIREMRETDHRFSNQKTRSSIAPLRPRSARPTNRSASLAPSTSRMPFLRQPTQETEAVLTGRQWAPPLSTKPADSAEPKVAWVGSPLTKSQQVFHFECNSAEVPKEAEPPSVEELQASAPTSAEAAKTSSSLAAVKEVEDEVDTPGPQDIQVMAAVEELGEGYHRTPDGYMEAEV